MPSTDVGRWLDKKKLKWDVRSPQTFQGSAMVPAISRITLYTRDMSVTAAFYQRYFGFEVVPDEAGGMIELHSPIGGLAIYLHPAAKSIKLGHVGIKLVFDVEDVEAFKRESAERGLVFGPTHQGDGYCFANAKDPDKNSLSISSRAWRQR